MSLSRRLQSKSGSNSYTYAPPQVGQRNALPEVDRSTLANRLKPRSPELMQVLAQVDHTVDETSRTEIMRWIQDDYDARQGGSLLGMFAKCFLGPPFIDHKLDLLGSILQHFSSTDDPGYPYSQARGLVRSGSYSFVEIYSDGTIVPILPDGTAVSM